MTNVCNLRRFLVNGVAYLAFDRYALVPESDERLSLFWLFNEILVQCLFTSTRKQSR